MIWDRNKVIKWLVELDHYPTVKEFQDEWGLMGINVLIENGDIIIDDGEVILTAITNPKLQKLVDEAVPLRGSLGSAKNEK